MRSRAHDGGASSSPINSGSTNAKHTIVATHAVRNDAHTTTPTSSCVRLFMWLGSGLWALGCSPEEERSVGVVASPSASELALASFWPEPSAQRSEPRLIT